MEPLIQHKGIVIPLDRANVDTDAIIPKQYLKSIHKTGFGSWLFDDWRYLDAGDINTPVASRRHNPDFVLNKPGYRSGSVLLARENFGCGSSREHAVWAIRDYGIRVVIAPSFADIFFNNCIKNGILPLVLESEQVASLMRRATEPQGLEIEVDLQVKDIRFNGDSIEFNIDETVRKRLIAGEDDIDLTLRDRELIEKFERRWLSDASWLDNN